jgi:hypothetical protein
MKQETWKEFRCCIGQGPLQCIYLVSTVEAGKTKYHCAQSIFPAENHLAEVINCPGMANLEELEENLAMMYEIDRNLVVVKNGKN